MKYDHLSSLFTYTTYPRSLLRTLLIRLFALDVLASSRFVFVSFWAAVSHVQKKKKDSTFFYVTLEFLYLEFIATSIERRQININQL